MSSRALRAGCVVVLLTALAAGLMLRAAGGGTLALGVALPVSTTLAFASFRCGLEGHLRMLGAA